jgi:imidazolonepropionase-like amidohydrolase/ABC-type multidrug transport system permease subunit
MKMFRGLVELVRAQLLETLRSRTALFWTLAFPLFFLFLFGSVMAHGDARAATYMMPGLFTNMLLGGTMFAVSARLVADRESGVLRRCSITPVSAVAVVLAHGITALLTQLVTFALLWGTARAVFHVVVLGSPTVFVATYLVGTMALLPMGLVIGSAARDSRSAPLLGNALFFPLMFLSGAAFPFALLPDGIQRVARFLPPTYLVEALHAVMVRGDSWRDLLPRLAVLVGFAVVGVAATARLFRWEGTQPMPRRALAVVLGGFAVGMLVAAILSPALTMARAPWTRRPEPGAAKGQVRVLRGMTVLDGVGQRIENARVTIRDHRIAEVVADSGAPVPPGAVVDDLSGAFLVPGLIDSHVHLGGGAGLGRSPFEFTPEREIHDTQSFLGVGVTAFVSLTDDLRDMSALREAVARGDMRAPRVFFAGASITARGGHPAAMFARVPSLAERLTRQVSTAEEAERAVLELSFRHVDLIKLVLEGGWPGHRLPRLDERAFRAAVAAAQRAHVPTTVHVSTDADARLAVDAGADGLEHVPSDLSDETIRRMAASKTTLTPTLGMFDAGTLPAPTDDPLVRRWADRRILDSLADASSEYAQLRARIGTDSDARADAVARAFRAGVTILAGSDSGNGGVFHGPALVREVELLVRRGGLSPTEALAAATSRAADRLHQPELGRIASGSVADLVVLARDPSVDVAALREVRAVYFGGLPLDRDRLFTTRPGSWLPGQND